MNEQEMKGQTIQDTLRRIMDMQNRVGEATDKLVVVNNALVGVDKNPRKMGPAVPDEVTALNVSLRVECDVLEYLVSSLEGEVERIKDYIQPTAQLAPAPPMPPMSPTPKPFGGSVV